MQLVSPAPVEVRRTRPSRTAMVVAAVAVVGLVGATLLASIGSSGSGGAPVVQRVQVDFDGLRFDPAQLAVRPGQVQVALHNGDAITHSFTIEALGVDVLLGAGESESATFEARPGTYTIVCTLPGHLEAGMEGRLSVS